jgi:two-component system sensor histidine kinase PilS (NtrC family)
MAASIERSLESLGERRLLAAVYIVRLSIGIALALAATLVRTAAAGDPPPLLLVLLILGIPLAWTLGSMVWTRRREIGPWFLGAQIVHDLLLVSAAVYLTGGINSEFATIYIVLIAGAGLLMGFRGAVAASVGSVVLYLGIAGSQISGRPVTEAGLIELPNLSGPLVSIQWNLVLTALVFLLIGMAAGLVGRRLRAQRQRLDELEEQLAEARIDAQDILNTVESGILSVDAEGEIDFVNYTARAQLGMSGVPRTRDFRGRAQPGAVKLYELLVDTLHTEREIEYVEVDLQESGDGERPFSVATTVLYDPRGQKKGAAAILKDIQHVKRLEELARQSDRHKAVAELAAGLAHEIQNPLAAIRSAVELLDTDEKGAEEDRLHGLIVREADRLTDLIGDFMAFSRMSLRARERVDIVAVVEDAIEVERLATGEGGPRFVYTSPNRSHWVEGDYNLLKQVCLNLLSNARAAVDEEPEGRIDVRIGGNPELPGLERASGPYVALEVRDNGPGIPNEAQSRIFDPFFTTRPTGFGMGLAIVHRIVDLHRGMVWVDSAPGGGSTFRVAFPRAG